jgi:MFS family permease
MKAALRFVLLLGIVSLFADLTYEGARSVAGPFLAVLGATALIVSVVAGIGELLGYGLRVVSGRLAERTGKYWPVTIGGYLLQMTVVPLLALATTWQQAAALIVLERIGKATRNPSRDAMLASAAERLGYGWGFGIHEALDQCGALLGPLLMALLLALHRSYWQAFAALVFPAVITIALVLIARAVYSSPEVLQSAAKGGVVGNASIVFWVYMTGAGLVAAGFADYSLVEFHFARTNVVSNAWIPVFYSVAMAASGGGSLLFGKLFDRFGMAVLIPVTLLGAAFAPLVFLGNFWLALIGSIAWGVGMGVQESIIPAAVANLVPRVRRPSAFGTFTGVYGVAWFAGSVLIGVLYTRAVSIAVVFCVATQLCAIPLLWWVAKNTANRPHEVTA